jgi:hypothetical protein
MTIAAATRWVSIRSAFVAGVASAITSGTSDSTVSTTVVRTKAVRGRRAKRARTTARTRPTSEKIAVSMANPRIGMGAPLTSRLMPAARPAAATAAVAALATAAATTPVVTSERVAGATAGAAAVRVAVMVASGAVMTGPVPVSHQGYEVDRPQSTKPGELSSETFPGHGATRAAAPISRATRTAPPGRISWIGEVPDDMCIP